MAGRAGRTLTGVLTALIVLAVGADIATRLVVQSSLEDRLQQELALSASPDVSIHGIPFLFHLARRRFPGADIEAEGLVAEGLRFRRAVLEVEDLRYTEEVGSIRARRGTGEAEVTDGAISDLLSERGASLSLSFAPGTATVSTAIGGTEVSASGKLRLRDGLLRFEPQDLPAGIPADALAFDLAMPEVIEGVSYRSLRLEEGVAILAVDLDDSVLQVRV